MPQLEEDEWPADGEQTTTEHEHLKDGGPRPDNAPEPAPAGAAADIPPDLAEKMTPPVD